MKIDNHNNHNHNNNNNNDTILESLRQRKKGEGGGASSSSPPSTTTTTTSMEDFDSLKRQATKLERHLEEQVARYQQVKTTTVAIQIYTIYTIVYNTHLHNLSFSFSIAGTTTSDHPDGGE
jgi:hypothetical protein